MTETIHVGDFVRVKDWDAIKREFRIRFLTLFRVLTSNPIILKFYIHSEEAY